VSEACYVDFEDPVLLLGKLVLSVPLGLQTAGRPVPCAVRLAKNDVFRDQLCLPVPVAVNYRFALLAEVRGVSQSMRASKSAARDARTLLTG